ncbi:MAG: response regulator [Armatimonadetes bacterium]|nr:response regulator [Armatimonadota bacterium]
MSAREVTILIAEDDDGHAELIVRNLQRAGLMNRTLRFRDGQEVLDYLFGTAPNGEEPSGALLLLLDIRMPCVDGIEVLRRIKASPRLRRVPVIVITTADDPKEVQLCHDLGCNSYINKPIQYDKFVEAITTLGLFLMVVEVPHLAPRERAT